MMLDAEWFHQKMRPALSASWWQRSFEPCQALCAELAPIIQAFTEEYCLGSDEPLLSKVANGLGFDRDFWQLLVGELFLFGAREFPEIESAPETLRCLLAPGTEDDMALPRECRAVIQQVHFGAHDLCFGRKYYRPERVGLNDLDDVARLSQYLDSIDPNQWTVDDLREVRNTVDDEERGEELEWAQQGFTAVQALYRHARACRNIIVCEVL